MASDWTSILSNVGKSAQFFGTVSAGVGAAQTAEGKKTAYRLLGKIAGQNVAFSGKQAAQAAKVGEFQQEQILLRAGEIGAKQKVALAANGVRITGGTARQLNLTNQYNRDRALLTIGRNTTQQINAAEAQMQSFLTKQSLYASEANSISSTQSGISGFLNSGGASAIASLAPLLMSAS